MIEYPLNQPNSEHSSSFHSSHYRCVMKMDHHCPWINNCCGHLNHAYFTSFLLLAPLGCSHAAIIFIMTMYTQLYDRVGFLFHCYFFVVPIILLSAALPQTSGHLLVSLLQISFGWSTVKINMSAARQFQPLIPFSVPAFAATLFALGLALGTTIAVGMLFFIQVHFSSGPQNSEMYKGLWLVNKKDCIFHERTITNL